MARIAAPKMAESQPDISKFFRKAAQIFSTIASSTNKKRPNVTTVKGRVRRNRIGQTKTFRIPITKDARRAVVKPRIRNPGTIADVTKSASADTNQCARVEKSKVQAL